MEGEVFHGKTGVYVVEERGRIISGMHLGQNHLAWGGEHERHLGGASFSFCSSNTNVDIIHE